MAERDAAIQERNLAISEKKAAIAERDMAILQRDSAISERNNAIIERDNALHFRSTSTINTNPSSTGAKHVHHIHQYDEGEDDAAEPPKSHRAKRPKEPKPPPPPPPPSRKASKSSKRANKQQEDETTVQDWKDQDLGLNQVSFDETTMPVPVCSCTGVLRPCYKWGNGGWQSSCCTTNLSMHPLPAVPNKRHARIGGRKMSGSAFNKLLNRLASAGQDLTNPVDLKEHWAKHGTNRYITIK
ncbi:hypothetical protein M569_04392 [Genlisea aurea]|uniref:GAGA-binding transcriptional activator n=1 Tax=Genlisea aurea TaxID=192259 RepID=S8E3W5_9LAMI|nr:hypothetical protein M569_04392 [Genlisea aurea]